MTKYRSISFSATKGKRFESDCNYILILETKIPGPGAYKNEEGSLERVKIGHSKFFSNQGSKFSHSKRKSYIDDFVDRNK